MSTITFEFHGQLLRLAGGGEQVLAFAAPGTLGEALSMLADARPDIAAQLERCACAIGDRLVLRRDTLNGGERIALLPPVAGG